MACMLPMAGAAPAAGMYTGKWSASVIPSSWIAAKTPTCPVLVYAAPGTNGGHVAVPLLHRRMHGGIAASTGHATRVHCAQRLLMLSGRLQSECALEGGGMHLEDLLVNITSSARAGAPVMHSVAPQLAFAVQQPSCTSQSGCSSGGPATLCRLLTPRFWIGHD